jgi:hypothetical protein
MLFGRYDFHSVFLGPAILPEYKGSTFRGAFGVALKKVICALKYQECTDCILRDQCIYCRVFETLPVGDKPNAQPPPHPFVIEPPVTTRSNFEKGEDFDFRVLLFGFANEYLHYFVYAFQEMGRIGLGKRVNGDRPGYRLENVMGDGKALYNHEFDRIEPADPVELQLDGPCRVADDEMEITIILETPLRLKFQNNLHSELSFHVLARAMLRRISSLCNHYGNGEPNLDYKGMVERAYGVRTIKSSLDWLDWTRYSNRQETRMQMGGLAGRITYTGRLAEFMPLIRYCEKVHVGKATTFGLGKIRTATP